MKYFISPKIAVSVLFAVCVGAFTAQANLLLYDGFATTTDSQSRQAYSTAANSCKLQDANAKSVASTTGLSSSSPWSQASGVVFSFPNKGLALPTAFADGTGDQFEARGGGAGYCNSSAPDGDLRAKNRAITSTMPTAGKLYYRCLMKIESTAYNSLKTTSWRYYGTGISATPYVNTNDANSYGNQDDLKNNGIRIGFTSPGASPQRVDIGVNIGGQYTPVLENIAAGTTYIAIVELDYDNDKANVYVAPVTDYDTRFAWTVENLTVASAVTASAMQVMFLDGSYKTNGGYVIFDEIAVGTAISDVAVAVAATAPALGDVSLSHTGAATYSVSAEVVENPADTVSWVADNGTAMVTNAFATAVATTTTATGTVSGLTADKTYQISVLAENTSGADEKVAGVFYAGELTLGTVTDADEYNCVPGGVEVSRATADPWPLEVNYTITGSDGTEGTTWVAPTAVTIPANAASAILPVVPLMDGDVTSNITITVTLAAGNYEIPAADSKTLTLANLAPPTGKKTWIAAENGNASNGDNWFPAGAPTASDHILFDGSFSTARCTWDAAATHTVASWEQTASYTASGQAGVIDFYTTYDDGDFPALAITGDCVVNGGKWTHKANSDAQVNRLSLTVGGDFAVGAGVEITASNKGYAQNKFPAGAAIGVHGGSVNDLSKVYGDFRHPIDIGAGGGSANMTGGGAIHIVVAGAATVNGNINARANQGSDGNQLGAGGSIYIQAASVAGSGYISAAGYGDNDTRQFGAGGRIAVVCTNATELAYPKANFRCNGSIGSYGQSSGGGTIFVKTASQQHGTLIVPNSVPSLSFVRWWPTKRGVTPIPVGESWELDSIEFRGQGILCVPEGTSLKVPLSGISSTNGERTGGILYEGGTLDFGSAPYTLTGNWTFCADAPYTFNGDVTITNGANFGGFKLAGHYTNDFAKCDVTVNGNLTIASGGYATVELCGPNEANTTAECGGGFPMHGGQMAAASGNKCYDSVFEPIYPGHFARNGDQGTFGVGGGVLKLTVTSNLVVNGRISADGTVRSKSSAAAGTVNIRAKTLSGSGSITATGRPGSIIWDSGYNGAGGRIAVRVTGEEVGTNGVWTTFAARGCATNQIVNSGAVVTAARNQNTSAGTIYLQGKSDGEKGGTIYVKNQASYDTSNVATWLPAGTLGDDAKDFAKSKLVIADRGVVAVGTNNLAFASISIAENSKIDLNGKIVKVKKAYLDGGSLSAGEYMANNSAVTGYVVDSVGGGKLIVGGGFSLHIR